MSSGARVVLGETELEIEVEEPEPELDPGATRLRERPPERDATIVGPRRCRGATRRPTRRSPAPRRRARPRAAPAGLRAAAPAPAAAAAPPPAAAAGARPFGTLHARRPRAAGAAAPPRASGAPAGIVFLVIIATAIALIIYFAAR